MQQYQELQARARATGREELTAADKAVVARARRIQYFLTQPFFTVAAYTKQPGQFVHREETVRSFAALLRGEYDDVPEDAFRLCGTLDQAIEKARAMNEPST